MTNVHDSKAARILIGAFIVPVVLYQCYVVVMAFRMATVLNNLLQGLGAEAPNITQWFLDYHKYLSLVPVLTVILAIDAARRDPPRIVYTAVLIFFCLVVTFAMQALINEAWFVPMFDLIKMIG